VVRGISSRQAAPASPNGLPGGSAGRQANQAGRFQSGAPARGAMDGGYAAAGR
jgi:hypothetical protein